MKAISLWQPWASLVAWGDKAIETRSWTPPDTLIGTGEWIAIHSTQRTPTPAWNQAWGSRHMVNALALHGVTRFNSTGQPGSLPGRAIVAVAQIRDVLTTDEVVGLWLSHRSGTVWNYHDEREHEMGDYTPGRYAWRLTNVIGLNDTPIQGITGHQRIWNLEPADELRVIRMVMDLAKRTLDPDQRQVRDRFVRECGTE